MIRKKVVVTEESDSGRNLEFQDINSRRIMSRPQFVEQIEKGKYPDYCVKKIHGLKTPVSNPDESENNNLG